MVTSPSPILPAFVRMFMCKHTHTETCIPNILFWPCCPCTNASTLHLLSLLSCSHTHAYTSCPYSRASKHAHKDTHRYTLHPMLPFVGVLALTTSLCSLFQPSCTPYTHSPISTFLPEHIHRHAPWFLFLMLPCNCMHTPFILFSHLLGLAHTGMHPTLSFCPS